MGGVHQAPEHVTEAVPDPAHTALVQDKPVSFEEYLYHAEITRAEEKAANERYMASRGPLTWTRWIKDRFSEGGPDLSRARVSAQEKTGAPTGEGTVTSVTSVTGDEWRQASRALRTAGWGAVFYLITTDILGPFSVPTWRFLMRTWSRWSLAQMGYGPGIALYTVFGVMAWYSGWILWKVFLGLDSDRYPLRSYGDLYLRVYGTRSRHLVNVAQGTQCLLFVAVLVLGNGQSVSQISRGQHVGAGAGICFVACLVIFAVSGFVLGQIRTLQRFSWLASAAVCINVLIMCLCIGVAATSRPNFEATEASFGPAFAEGPIRKYVGTPPDGAASGGSGFVASLNGLNQAVYAYGGAMVFPAFMAEMRHPLDFWKSLLMANLFIYVAYLVFGLCMYSYQGQYSFNPAVQGLSPYGWQTAGNTLNIITGLIAAVLYGNIGLKVIYVELLQNLLRFPPLTATRGKLLWAALIPMYWSVALAISAAIPHFSFISGLVGALFILSFTYTLPALLALGYCIRADAMTPEERFHPATRTHARVDAGLARLARAYMKRPLLNTCNAVYLLGGLVTTALGVYSSVEALIAAFDGARGHATSFGCASPV